MGPKYHLPKIDPIFYGIPRLGTRIGNTNRVMEGSVWLQNIGQNLGMTEIEAIFYLALQTLRRRRGDVKDLHVVVILAVRRAHRVRHGDRNRPVFWNHDRVRDVRDRMRDLRLQPRQFFRRQRLQRRIREAQRRCRARDYRGTRQRRLRVSKEKNRDFPTSFVITMSCVKLPPGTQFW